MKLFTFPMAPNPARIDFYLREKNLQLETVIIDLPSGEHRQAAHLARHPGAAVPVLELDDGRFLIESLAIIEYLEECYPSPAMIGETPEDRAFTRATERFIELQIFLRLVRYIHATNSPIGLPPNPALADNELRYLPDALTRLDNIIGDHDFVTGNRPTIADCTLMGGLRFALVFGWKLDAQYSNVSRRYALFSGRHQQ